MVGRPHLEPDLQRVSCLQRLIWDGVPYLVTDLSQQMESAPQQLNHLQTMTGLSIAFHSHCLSVWDLVTCCQQMLQRHESSRSIHLQEGR